jgi:outer membrane protein OmpA-like peptidoglycan-associated protein
MMTSDNLLNVSQNFFSPDVVQKFSNIIGQSTDKTKIALMSVIPTLMNGIVNKGSTPEGAASLVDMTKKQNFELSTTPDESKLSQGNEVMNSIFGSNLMPTASKIGESTGLNTSSITKIFSLAAPVVMGVIGSKIKNEKLRSMGLMNFLGQQKTLLSGFTSGAAGFSTAGENVGGVQKQIKSQNISWTKIALAALILLGLLFWWFGTHNKTTVQTTTAIPPAISIVTPSINELSAFMKIGTESDLPKKFRFEHLNFETNTTILTVGAETEAELDNIAAAMKEYPASKARLEGYTDNIGDSAANQALSASRAIVVKDQLVSRGISAERIEALGLGSSNPIGNNETAEGRAENRRIDFIITQIK